MAEVRQDGRALLALALSAALVVSIALGCVLGLGRLDAFATGLAFDLCCIGWAYLAVALLARSGLSKVLLVALLAVVLAAQLGLVFAHAWFFDVAIERRLTLLDLTGAGLYHFFAVSLPAPGLVAFFALYAGLFGGAVMLTRYLRRGLGARALGAMALLLAGATALSVRAERVASPLFDSAQEGYALVVRPRVVARRDAHTDRLVASLDKHARTHAAGTPSFSKVIVVVMETMTAKALAEQRAELPRDRFFVREKPHLHEFERYYPNNQDSRTGMLDMLFSRVIPYEAYSDEGYAGYRHLADRPSLADSMAALGYQTAFAVAQVALEEVASELKWSATLHLDAREIAAAQASERLCFTPDEWEQSCEDLVLLPEVVEFVAKHPRAFVYQEMIWGHAYEYNAASGLSNAAYYAKYLDALVEALQARGLLDDTLIAITSDHGFRDKGRQHDPESYRVPLSFYAPRFQATRDARLTSHVDFGMLLLEELVPGAARADDNPLVMIVGPTGQGHTFVVDRQGGHVLLWRRLGSHRLMALVPPLAEAPAQLLGVFEQYRAQFDQAGRGSLE